MDTNQIKITPKWTKTKEEIWNERFEALPEKPKSTPLRRLTWFRYTAVAAIILLTALPFVAYLYTTTITVDRGQHLTVVLPDQTKVDLNAESRLSYKPLWWAIKREVNMSGEAFFQVQKGSLFQVNTPRGVVSVLGTTFNIFARDKQLQVTCLTGKVKVETKNEETILTSNMQAQIKNNQLATHSVEQASQAISWREKRFYFSEVPLKAVIEEIERQYNISVTMPEMPETYYSGSFSSERSPKEILEIIGKPFGLKFKIN